MNQRSENKNILFCRVAAGIGFANSEVEGE